MFTEVEWKTVVPIYQVRSQLWQFSIDH